MSPLSGRC
uniref:Uncharacterized protein n=1 Tax=Anguilla anguilla TaxID=7936 RepID=A0A0E9SXP4_ANGAN